MTSREPAQLTSARDHLARAEAAYGTADGLFHLEEGLALLDEVIAADDECYTAVARNVAATYAARIYGSIGRLLQTDRAIPEPQLEHLFKVVLAFDEGDFALPANERTTKLGIARQLIERYYEGHPPERKGKALEELDRYRS